MVAIAGGRPLPARTVYPATPPTPNGISTVAATIQTRGPCAYCGRELTSAGVGRHLGTCGERVRAIGQADAARGKPKPMLHLHVRNAHTPRYWLHLEMDGTAPLKALDDYLRRIWLECCGHLSEFSLGGWGGRVTAPTRRIADVLPDDRELTHIYDFGTETVSLIRAVDRRAGKRTTRQPIALMARNGRPEEPCMECGEPAAWLCVECINEYDEPGTLCDAHAAAHPHDEYGDPMPLVNSPRAGVCGYEGPADPPY